MLKLDRITEANQKYWNSQVNGGNIYTRPWLDLPAAMVRAFAAGEIDVLPEPYAYIYPQHLFRDVAGKDVLCLASGGGQQSAVFGLLGARVTVFDLTEGQLEGDRRAAAQHGYQVTTVQGDMRDLSVFVPGSFDIVFQEISICFVPDVRPVYREVARVLGPGGLYRIAHLSSATQCALDTSWDGVGYRIACPYRGGEIEDVDDSSREFRHLLSDTFNGLVEAGLAIQGVWEDPRHLHHDCNAMPGSYEHYLTYVAAYFAIVARKPP